MSQKKSWQEFSRLVAAIYHAKSAGGNITWNEKINGHQFDVTIRYNYEAYQYLTVIDCKDYKVATEEVEAFVIKAKDADANTAIMISSHGYQSGCEAVGERNDVELLMLKKECDETKERVAENLIPALNMYDLKIIRSDNNEEYNFPKRPGGELLYLVEKTEIICLKKIYSLKEIFTRWQLTQPKSISNETNYFKIDFPPGTVAVIPQEVEKIPIKSIKFKGKIIKARRVKKAAFDPYLEGQENLSYVLKTIRGDIKSAVKAKDLEFGFDTELKEGHFYVDPKLNFFYFCEKIKDDTVYWILVESYQHGDLLQVKFTQSTEYAKHYVEVKDKEDLKKVKLMLNKLIEKEKESDFLKLIEEIDEAFRKQNIPIFQRPLRAIREICIRHKISLNVIPNGPAVPGLYTGDSLVAHVHEWYKKRYGDRLKLDASPGSAAIIIKNDPWLIEFQAIFGEVKCIFDPNLEKYNKIGSTSGVLNPLTCIQGFTSDYASSLSRDEMLQLAAFFKSTLDTLLRLFEFEIIFKFPYISEARADLRSAVAHIFSNPPHFGQSKWASLQLTEKLLKCFLKQKNVSFPKNHDLTPLSIMASQNGLQIIPLDIIRNIQCPADVRYGEIAVNLEEAILAHHSSLKVCSILVPAIKAINVRSL